VRNRVESELLAGEELLWVGRPAHVGLGSVPINGAVVAIALVFILGLSAALFMAPAGVTTVMGEAVIAQEAVQVIPQGGEIITREIASASPMATGAAFAALIPLFLILVVFAAVMLPLYRRRQTVYAVTDRRALIMEGTRTRSFGANDIEFIERRMARNGTGDVIFATQIKDRYAGNSGRRIVSEPVGFLGIERPQQVEALMLGVFRGMGGKLKNDLLDDKPKNDDLDLYDVEIGPDGEIQERRR
jgi:hypothetical protein